jgi:thioredoxin 1
MVVEEISSSGKYKDVLMKEQLIVIDCYATWCGPCNAMSPIVKGFSDEFPTVHFCKIDVDEMGEVAKELGVRAMPTFFLFKNGEKVDSIVGADASALKAAIEKHK